MKPLSILAAVVTALALALPLRPFPSQAASHHASAAVLAHVRFVYHSMTKQPPGSGRQAAHNKDSLFSNYGIQTGRGDKGALGFQDGTTLHINQNTDLVLASPHVTQVRHGEVAQYLAPGSNHQVQTAQATASAIGTEFDVRTQGSSSVFVVLHGALQVANHLGHVLVKSNHQTVVPPNHAPLPPSPVDAKAVFAWNDGIPTPDLGENVALDANGGQVIHASSQRSPGTGGANHIHDGLLSQGWETATGRVSNQSVTIGFLGNTFYRISDIIIDPAATYGDASSEDLKDFAIRVSTTGSDDASFTTVFHGTCKRQDSLQHFHLPVPERAKYIQLVATNNYGSTQRLAVAELEIVATASLFGRPEGVALDSHGFLYVADTYANRVDKVSQKGKIVAHWGSKGSGPGQLLGPEGVAVARNGDVYVADTQNFRVEKFAPNGRFLTAWGSQGIGNGQFSFPHGIAVDRQGNVLLADYSTTFDNIGSWFIRVQKFGANGKFLANWSNLADAGQLPSTGDLTIDSRGNIWVTDTGADTVLEVSPKGQLLRTLGGPGRLNEPEGVAVDKAGNVYVSDSFNSRVQKIAGSQMVSWGSFGVGRNQFEFPSGLALSPSGTLYVADSANARIKLMSTAGKVRRIWGKYATIPTILGQPAGVAIDPHGDVWITDATNDRLQVRSPDGRVLAILGYHGAVSQERGTRGLGQFFNPRQIAIDRHGEIYVADANNCRIQELAPRGPIGAIGQCGKGNIVGGPYGVAVDAAGNIYVADTLHSHLYKLSKSGKVIWRYGVLSGTAPGELDAPTSVAVDHEGNVYVADTGNPATGGVDGRVLKISPDGKLLATFGRYNPSELEGRFVDPEGLAVDSHDNLYVTDELHNAVQKLTTDGKLLAVYPLPSNSNPTGIAVDQKGVMYVTNYLGRYVLKMAPTGEILAIWS